MMANLPIDEIRASVRIANHHPVTAQQAWERSIPDPQLICILAGAFLYQERGRAALEVSEGAFLFIEPGARHRFSLAPGVPAGEMAGMHFEFTPTGRWAAGDYRPALLPPRVTRPDEAPALQEHFKRMAAAYESYRPFRKALVDAIATEILLTLAAYWGGGVARAPQPSARMEAILAYIRAHLEQPLTRQRLAETFNLSAGYINQLFQVELGMSPTAVINRERVARAYDLMNTAGLPVSEAARAVGFQDPFYFSRVFKAVYTVPPSQVASRK